MQNTSKQPHRVVAVVVLVLALILLGREGLALPQDAAVERFDLGDFELESGEVIEGAFLTYVTHGELNQARNNAILVPPPLMSDHTRHDFLIGPGLGLDPERYFIIATNTFGNGQAISPSNSETQPGFDFPQFSIRDMVNAQHRLVTGEFQLDALLAVVGASMGGMQAYEWAASYPGFVAAAVPIITVGRTTSWITAIWETHRRAITADFEAATASSGITDGAPTTGFRSALGGLLVWSHHWYWMNEEFADDNLDVIRWLEEMEETLLETRNPIDYVYQTRAEDLHNIAEAPGMNGDYENALRSIRARTLLMPATNDLLHPIDDSRQAAELIPNAKLVEIDSPIGHLGGGGTLERDRGLINREIAAFLEEVAARRSQ